MESQFIIKYIKRKLDQSSFNLLEYKYLPSTGDIAFDGLLIREIAQMIEIQWEDKNYIDYFVSGQYYAFAQNFNID